MGFPRQEYWSGLPCPLPGFISTQRCNPCLLCLLHWQAESLLLSDQGIPDYRSQTYFKVSIGILNLRAVQKLIVMLLGFMTSTIIKGIEIGFIFLYLIVIYPIIYFVLFYLNNYREFAGVIYFFQEYPIDWIFSSIKMQIKKYFAFHFNSIIDIVKLSDTSQQLNPCDVNSDFQGLKILSIVYQLSDACTDISTIFPQFPQL